MILYHFSVSSLSRYALLVARNLDFDLEVIWFFLKSKMFPSPAQNYFADPSHRLLQAGAIQWRVLESQSAASSAGFGWRRFQANRMPRYRLLPREFEAWNLVVSNWPEEKSGCGPTFVFRCHLRCAHLVWARDCRLKGQILQILWLEDFLLLERCHLERRH